ncbi:MAG: FlgD immunoglobulin-like domain containing protein, partial [Candidatus Stygibacter australis]|nr:FlgD immunoglobulin-like domain containing protein [Candidatus Stygibacter australis]
QIPLSLTADWNWIGHLPQDPIPLIDLMAQLEPDALQIKAQNISSTWFTGYGWVGQLNVLEPGVGYKLKMAQPDTLIYPDTRQYPEYLLPEKKSYLWDTAKGFENNMTLLASIATDQYEVGDIIQAGYFDDADICHGAGEYIVELGLWYFTIAGNVEGESLHLRLLMADDQEYICEPVIEFCNNAIMGEPESPEIFNIIVTDNNDNEIPEITSLGQSYPNPCLIDQQRMNLNISYNIAEPGRIKLNIFNSKGQLVRKLINQDQEPGSFIVNWDGRDERGNCVSAGVYLYQLTASKRTYNRKLLLLR